MVRAANRVSFHPLDRKYQHLESVASEIASFLFDRRGMIQDFHRFLKGSISWTKQDYSHNLDRWFSRSYARIRAQDHLDFKDLLRNFFSVCNSQSEIRKMRGLVPEKLVELIFKELNYSQTVVMETGAEVQIDGDPVRYYVDENEKKRTVDLGTWNQTQAEFVEVKCSPRSFRQKDIHYLRLLAKRMRESNLEFQTYLVTLDDKDYTRLFLEEENLWDTTDQFKIVGKEDIFLFREQIA